MRVIGAGFGRTGTMSLKAALEDLGFGPCYHMTELLDRPDHLKYWYAAGQGERIDWKDVFGEYQATVDWPGCALYKELMEAYPEAKVLLSVRDPEEWYESARNTTYDLRKTAASSLLVSLTWPFIPTVRRAIGMTDDIIWKGTFGGRFDDRQHAIEVFERHVEKVKEHVPSDRLLVYEVKDGWEPLCEFLNVDVPEGKPFPRLNDRDAFQKIIRKRFVLPSATRTAGALSTRLIVSSLRDLTSRASKQFSRTRGLPR